MSLSKNRGETNDKEKSWHTYEMESFEPDNYSGQDGKNKFTSLEVGKGKKSDFVPLEAWGSGDKKNEKTEGHLSENKENDSNTEQEVYERGFAQGEKDGFEFGEKKAIKVIENIENLLSKMTSLKHEILKQYENEIIDLIFSVAEKIVHYEVRSKESAIKNAIFDALELAVEKSKVIFNVNPDDYEFVEKLRPELFNQYKRLKSIVVTSDPGISRGGCYLETPYGNIDATIESKLEKIHQCLKGSIE